MFTGQTSGGQRDISPLGMRVLHAAPITGYILAQLIVIGALILRMWTLGIADAEERNVWIGELIVTAFGSVPLALVVGVFDGVVRAIGQPILRALVAVLVLVLSGWIAWYVYTSADSTLFSNEIIVPSLPDYLGMLAGGELALISELVLAIVIARSISFIRSWLRR